MYYSHIKQREFTYRIFVLRQEETVLETKGDAILAMYVAESAFACRDLIVGDNEGNVVVFSNNEILSRKRLMYSITALAPEKDLGMDAELLPSFSIY